MGGAAEPARRPALSPPIEIARGLAALGVLLFHAYILVVGFDQDLSFFGGNAPRLFAEMPTPYLAGYVLFGFAFFRIPLLFVLSGYCVHLARAAAGPGGLDARRFLARRLLRLYPLYLAVVVSLFVLFGPLLGQHEKHGVNGTNLLGHLFFWHYAGPPASAGMGITFVFWTVALEVQFYLLYALLHPLLARAGLGRCAAAALAAGVLYRIVWAAWLADLDPHPVLAPERFAPVRFGEWLLGAYLAELHVRRRSPVGPPTRVAAAFCGCALIAGGIAAGGLLPLDKSASTEVTGALGSFLVVAACLLGRRDPAGPIDRPSWSLLRALSRRCYSLYLTHVVVVSVFRVALVSATGAGLAPSWWGLRYMVMALAAAAALAVAEVAYRLVERPSHALARRLTAGGLDRPRPAAPAVLAGLRGASG